MRGMAVQIHAVCRAVRAWGALAAVAAASLAWSPALASAQDPSYEEPFRPQYHFTPAKNWMNDPNGLVYHDGEYHLFYQHNPFGDTWGHMSWGHAVSTDLVHWEHLPVAIREEGDEAIFSGSAVVDKHNSSGFGTAENPPMVAIYTSARPDDQEQSLAYSTDRGRTFKKYEGNPVLDDPDREFRDPKVFWYEPEQKWIMVVVKAVQRKVAIYESENLKDWVHLSDFGPAGAVGGVWECPDLFQIAVDGNPANRKWVMVVSLNPGGVAGGSATQYFLGDFDGERFVADPEPPYVPPTGTVYQDFESGYDDWTTTGTAFGDGPTPGNHPGQGGVTGYEGQYLANSFRGGDGATGTLTSPAFTVTRPYINLKVGGGAHARPPGAGDGTPPTGTVFEDFESETWGDWTPTGTFAEPGNGPATGTLPGQMTVSGYEGERLANTFYNHDSGTGTVTSPQFQITTDYINFLIGGGPHANTTLTLIVDGQVVRSRSGSESEAVNWANWNVADLKGRTAQLQIVDQNAGGWGHVLVDHIMFSDEPALPRPTETAVNVIVDGQVVRSITGEESETLDWAAINVRDFIGRQARIEIVDRNTGGWGHVLADHIVFADAPAQSTKERARWLDHGKDYYAAISWEDAPDGRRLMIGWMNNWQYANQIPTSPWRSAMSVPREIGLRTIGGRVELVSEPVKELRRQRSERPYHLTKVSVDTTTRTLESCRGKSLEIVAEITMGDAETAGLKVRTGAGEETVIGYNAPDGEVWVDRSNSGEDGFSRSFPGVQRAPLTAIDGKVKLHVLVDWSSVEVFADRGQRVITDQIFPADSSDGLQLFASGGTAQFDSLDIWTLRSIWDDEDAVVTGCDAQPEPEPGQGNPNPGQGNPGQGNPNPGQGRGRAFGRIAAVGATARCYRNARMGQKPTAGERAMQFAYRLTAAAPVRLTVKRRNRSPAWRSCPPRRGKQVFPYTDVGSWEESGREGDNRTEIGSASRRRMVRRAGLLLTRAHRRGRVSLRRMLQDKVLTPGTYVLTVASLDESGRVSSTANVKFWVIAPKPRR